MLAPGKLHSFWTMVYSGMWFDTEPYFLEFLDSNRDWWQHYYACTAEKKFFPAKTLRSPVSRCSARPGFLLGLFPLALVLVGCFICVSGKWKTLFDATPAQRAILSLFPVLLAFNVVGIIALALRLPVFIHEAFLFPQLDTRVYDVHRVRRDALGKK